MLKYSESPLLQLPYLELFQSGGGGGQSRDIFRGCPVKKITLYHVIFFYLKKHFFCPPTSKKCINRDKSWYHDKQRMTMLGHRISGRVQTFRRSPFVPSHNFCHPEIWMDLSSLRHQVAPSSVFIQFRLAPSGVAENEKKGTDLLPSKFSHYPLHPIPFHYPNRAPREKLLPFSPW